MRKLTIFLGLVVIIISLWATVAFADDTITSNSTYDLSQCGSNAVLTINSGLTVTLTNTTNTTYTNLSVSCGSNVSLTISGLSIDNSSTGSTSARGRCALEFEGPGSTLTIVDENTLKSGSKQAGVSIEGSTTSLSINGDGILNTYGGFQGSGIGCGSLYGTTNGRDLVYGDITIYSGTINASGGTAAAGIGSSNWFTNGGSINIYGGTINAKSLRYGAGIGSGYYHSSCGDINIYDGVITATGHTGIGGGYYHCSCGNISIYGGNIYAHGNGGGCGIGNGQSPSTKNKVDISGGTICAQGWSSGSGEKDIDASELTITGDAAIFLRYNRCATPTTCPYHTHVTKSGTNMVVVDGVIYGISGTGISPWTNSSGGYFILRTLTYNANGGSGTLPSSAVFHITGQATIASGSSLSLSGYTFSGWQRATPDIEIYQPGVSLTVDEDITLYALWRAFYTALFDSQGGSSVNSQTVPGGGTLAQPNSPTNMNYIFNGWYTDTNYTTKWDFDTDTVTNNITLYAKWTVPASAMSNMPQTGDAQRIQYFIAFPIFAFIAMIYVFHNRKKRHTI